MSWNCDICGSRNGRECGGDNKPIHQAYELSEENYDEGYEDGLVEGERRAIERVKDCVKVIYFHENDSEFTTCDECNDKPDVWVLFNKYGKTDFDYQVCLECWLTKKKEILGIGEDNKDTRNGSYQNKGAE